MKIALCTQFLQEDSWRARLCAAVPSSIRSIVDCGGPADISAELEDCTAAVVALDGPAGLTAVRAIRKASTLPILWIADEADYALFAYQYHVTEFLLRSATAAQLAAALTHLKEEIA